MSTSSNLNISRISKIEDKKNSYYEFAGRFAYYNASIHRSVSNISAHSAIIESKKVIVNKTVRKQSSDVAEFIVKTINSIKPNLSSESEISSQLSAISPDQSGELLLINKASSSESPEEDSKARVLNKRDNVYDSDEEMSSDGEVDSPWVVRRNSSFRKMWEFLITLAMAYISLVQTFQMAFEDEDTEFDNTLNITLDVVFLADICLRFFFTYKNAFDSEVKKLSKVAKNYLLSWFLLDLVSSIPFNTYVILAQEEDNDLSALKLVKMYRVVKWFRVLKFVKFANTKIDYEGNKKGNKGRIISLFGLWLAFMHVFSNFFIYFASLSDSDNWITYNNMGSASKLEIYVASFYFHMVSMFSVGYGDIGTVSVIERLYINCFLIIGLFIYSTFLSFALTFFSKIDIKMLRLNAKLKILNDIERAYNLDKSLYKKIKSHIVETNKKILVDRYQMLETLPTKYGNELIYTMHSGHIRDLDFLKHQNHDFIIYILPKMKPLKVVKDELLYSKGEYLDEMYLVTKGKLSLEHDFAHYRLEVAQIRESFHFGEYHMSKNLQMGYTFSNKARLSEVLVLKKADFNGAREFFGENIEEILEKSKDLVEIIQKRAKLIESLFKYTSKKAEIKQLLKQIDFYILKKGFNLIFEQDICFETIKDNILKMNYDEILKSLALVSRNTSEENMKVNLRRSFDLIENKKQAENGTSVSKLLRMNKNFYVGPTLAKKNKEKKLKNKSTRYSLSAKNLGSIIKTGVRKAMKTTTIKNNYVGSYLPCVEDSFSIQKEPYRKLKVTKAFSVHIDDSTDEDEPNPVDRRRKTALDKIASSIAKLSRDTAMGIENQVRNLKSKQIQRTSAKIKSSLRKSKVQIEEKQKSFSPEYKIRRQRSQFEPSDGIIRLSKGHKLTLSVKKPDKPKENNNFFASEGKIGSRLDKLLHLLKSNT